MHDLAPVNPDIELAANHVDVSGRVPVGAGVRAVRIAERNMDARDLLILENVADHIANGNVGADGEFANAVAVFIGVAVIPELLLQGFVCGVSFDKPVVLYANGKRVVAAVAVFLAEIIAYHAIAHKDAVDTERRGESLTAGKIAPFVRADNAAGL